MNEDSILQKIRNWCASTETESTILGIGDDAAAVQIRGGSILFCSDFCIEGTHFDLSFSSPRDVGHKSLARVLSDIAAMGGIPRAVTISLAVPSAWSETAIHAFLESYYDGATTFARENKTAIAGGDLSRLNGPLTIDVAAVGEAVVPNVLWRRSGARSGDLAYLTGAVGAAALALREMKEGRGLALAPKLAAAHQRPRPRFDVAKKFASSPVQAAIDISDGLIRDAFRICNESRLSLVIYEDLVPIIETSIATATDLRELALNGGDDYELLLALPATWAHSPEGRDTIETGGLICIGRFESQDTEQGPSLFLESRQKTRRLVANRNLLVSGHDPFRDT